MGGALRAIETGFIQSEIQNAAYTYQRKVESGEQAVVGVNRFQMDENQSIPTFHIDPAQERAQIERLRQVRASRSQTAVDERLTALEHAARTSSNLMPPILEAAACYTTVGEISDRLRTVLGEYAEP